MVVFTFFPILVLFVCFSFMSFPRNTRPGTLVSSLVVSPKCFFFFFLLRPFFPFFRRPFCSLSRVPPHFFREYPFGQTRFSSALLGPTRRGHFCYFLCPRLMMVCGFVIFLPPYFRLLLLVVICEISVAFCFNWFFMFCEAPFALRINGGAHMDFF